jgi:FAD:protein FMN transferase
MSLLSGLLLVAATAVAQRPPAPASSASIAVERTVLTMGTTLGFTVEAADRPTALSAGEALIAGVAAVERRWSTWLERSELTRLHQTPPGEACALSHEFLGDWRRVRAWSHATGGAFDPTVGALVDAYELRAAGRWPEPALLAAARAAVGASLVGETEAGLVRRHAGVRLDAGAFGKGLALDEGLAAACAVGAHGVLVDFGGQLAVAGRHERPLEVVIADPRCRARAAVRVPLCHGSIATTGNGERGRVVDGKHLGHVLDPRTGLPAADFGSVTVLAENALTADCLSTALFVLGPDAALAFAAAHDGIEVLVLVVDGDRLHARATPGLAATAVALLPGLTLP